MVKRLSADERKTIDQLEGQGFKAHEIGARIGRDTRTVKHYLIERPREQSVGLEKLQRELEHRNDIRERIRELESYLEFPSPENLDIGDLSKGVRGFDLECKPIQWQQTNDGRYTVKLYDDFRWVIQHLRSSRQKATLDNLEQWQSIGGSCIEDCHDLRLHIVREAERQTGLVAVLDNGQRGLLDGFSLTIYRWALCSDKQGEYKIVSRREGLCLLSWGMYNLAWVRDDEVERIKDIHRKLIEYYRRLSTTVAILREKQDLQIISEILLERLSQFAGLPIMPGECDGCPN